MKATTTTAATTTVLAVLTLLAFALPAFASRDIRLSEIKIQGNLVCANNGGNDTNGAPPCTLKIKDTKNGQIFNLIEAQEAYKMYSNGQKSVAIEGMITTSDTIRVSRITAL